MKSFLDAKRLRPDKMCALMLDLNGRQIHMTATEGGQDLDFKKGDMVEVRLDDCRRLSHQKVLYLDYIRLTQMIAVNERITFDGGVVAVVREIILDEVRIEIQNDGCIKSQSPVRLEGKRYEFMPLFRDEDKEALKEAVEHHFDYIVLSAVTSAKDIQQARLELKNLNHRIGVIAKVDTVEGLHQFENVLKLVDGVVIMRSDLANEMSPEKLQIAQKWMI
mgnify:CR=1 FL=1